MEAGAPTQADALPRLHQAEQQIQTLEQQLQQQVQNQQALRRTVEGLSQGFDGLQRDVTSSAKGGKGGGDWQAIRQQIELLSNLGTSFTDLQSKFENLQNRIDEWGLEDKFKEMEDKINRMQAALEGLERTSVRPATQVTVGMIELDEGNADHQQS